MFIEDLSTDAFLFRGESIRAIGWLEGGHPYRRGVVPAPSVTRLKKHIADAFTLISFLGFHVCSLCPAGEEQTGRRNLLVPSERILYVAPEMIVHYVEDHGYCPPEEFLSAVMTCPEQGSTEFMSLLRRFEDAYIFKL